MNPLITSELGKGDPSARPMLTRIYGMIGCLIVTLALIALIVVLQKTLPDGTKSHFHPSWRRNVVDIPPPLRDHDLAGRQDDITRGTCASSTPVHHIL